MISQDRLEKAMTYLAETDEEAADKRAVMERLEYKAKATKDAIFMRRSGTVAERTAAAGCDGEYGDVLDLYFAALKDFEHVRNKRQTEVLVVDVWRSMNANRRQG